ncbi:HAD-IA family hydrolase [Nocardioides sp. NPDC000445]|uniref:HAD family hydrolase n=1 Tax=Nocardioides sp. NPDC000445 TaxID=3154257 RepID=UPI00333494AD
MTEAPIAHVVFDADGVLQHLPGGWHAAVAPLLGDRTEEILQAAWAAEAPMLTGGDGDFRAVLAGVLLEHGAAASAEEVYVAAWGSVQTDHETADVVRRVRAAGYGAHLGTNQASHRSALMRTELGYDDLFDVSCYSYELGVAKPDPRFFLLAAGRIGAEPHEILFIDDSVRNIVAARSVGMAALHWSFDPDAGAEHTGQAGLVDRLAAHGVHL